MKYKVLIILLLIINIASAQSINGGGYQKVLINYEDGSVESGYIKFKKNIYDTFFTSTKSKETIQFKKELKGKTIQKKTREIHSLLFVYGDGKKLTLYKVPVRKTKTKTGIYSKREDILFLNKYIDGPLEVYGYMNAFYDAKSGIKRIEDALFTFMKKPGDSFATVTKNLGIQHTIPRFVSISQMLNDCPEAKTYLDENYTNIKVFKLKYYKRITNRNKEILEENKEYYKSLSKEEKNQFLLDVNLKVQLEFYHEINEKYKEFCMD